VNVLIAVDLLFTSFLSSLLCIFVILAFYPLEMIKRSSHTSQKFI